jgi:hypothetical protein
MFEKEDIEDTLAMTGLFLTLCFCLSPLPTLYYSLKTDHNLIKSISLPGILMNLSSAVVITSYCGLLEM